MNTSVQELAPQSYPNDLEPSVVLIYPSSVIDPDTIYLDQPTLSLDQNNAESDRNLIDNEICEIIKSYFATLQNGDRSLFRKLDFDDKLDLICWNWARDDTDQDKFQTAVRLKSLNIVRSLEYAARQQDDQKHPERHTKPYLLPVQGDTFWCSVEIEIDQILRDYGDLNQSVEDPDNPAFSFGDSSISMRVLNCKAASVWKTYIINNDQVSSVTYTTAW